MIIEQDALPTGHCRAGSVLAFSGSLRRGSWNTRLLKTMAGELSSHGVLVTELSLRNHLLPIYDPDIEAESGVPATAVELRELISRYDGLLIACPEYNGSVTPVLKNTLDWCSRPVGQVGGLAPFQQKPVLIIGTSIGPFGALRAIGHLRAILSKMGAMVWPEDLAVPNATAAFTGAGLADSATAALAARAAAAFISHMAHRGKRDA